MIYSSPTDKNHQTSLKMTKNDQKSPSPAHHNQNHQHITNISSTHHHSITTHHQHIITHYNLSPTSILHIHLIVFRNDEMRTDVSAMSEEPTQDKTSTYQLPILPYDGFSTVRRPIYSYSLRMGLSDLTNAAKKQTIERRLCKLNCRL